MAMVVVCLGPPLSHDCCDMKKMFKYGIENKALAEMKAHIVAELFTSCANNTKFSGLCYHSSKGCAGRFRSFHIFPGYEQALRQEDIYAVIP